MNVLEYGAIGDGETDDTEAIQQLLDNHSTSTLYLAEDHIFSVRTLNIPSNKTLVIDGILRVHSNVHYDYDYYELLYGNNVENIVITGNGVIDGNKNALVNGYFSLIKFENSKNIEVSIKKVGYNRLPREKHASVTLGCIYFIDCSNIKIHDLYLTDWSREGIWLVRTNNSYVNGIYCEGGPDSWSGLQIYGVNNIVNSCHIIGSGASGISLDSKYSILSNCIVEGNIYFHSFNFGHEGCSTENCQIINCFSKNSAENGFNFGFGSTNNNVSNCVVDNALNAGFNISNLASEISFDKIKANCCKYGLKIFETSIKVSNADFTGNSSSSFWPVDSNSSYEFMNVRLSSDPMVAAINLVNTRHENSYKPVEKYTDDADGFIYYRVTNKNVRPLSKIRIEPVHGNTALAGIFLREINVNFFVVGVAKTPRNPAWFRFYIE